MHERKDIVKGTSGVGTTFKNQKRSVGKNMLANKCVKRQTTAKANANFFFNYTRPQCFILYYSMYLNSMNCWMMWDIPDR